MVTSIRAIIRALARPDHRLSCSPRLWRELLRELHQRGHNRRESGAFLLGRIRAGRARVEHIVFYDDLDPHCLDTGIVVFDPAVFGELFRVCREVGLEVVADVHTHGGSPWQSEADRTHPAIQKRGHIALIVPNFARSTVAPRELGLYEYAGQMQWHDRSGPRAAQFFSPWMDLEMNTISPDTLHRTLKAALDSGEVASLEAAHQLFGGYRLHIAADSGVAQSPTRQAALFTAINVGKRCFLGGVFVTGCPNTHLLVPLPGAPPRLQEAVIAAGGILAENVPLDAPVLHFGAVDEVKANSCALRLSFEGWRGAAIARGEAPLPEVHENVLSGVLAASLGVSEAFQWARGKNVYAGRRSVGLSLWRPELPWREEASDGPEFQRLPSKLWLIGLGHLGQAYLWTLGVLPFATPSEVHLVLQDVDSVQDSNLSTSVLSEETLLGQSKTRAMTTWCAQRGFRTSLIERHFTGDFQVQSDEPPVALCGVDNALARAALEDVGFAEVIEVGLGSGAETFLGLQMHSFSNGIPGRRARDIWGQTPVMDNPESLLTRPAYLQLERDGADVCGLTLLAGRAVGASFVGVFASTLVIAETLRLTMGGPRYSLADVHLREPDNRVLTPLEGAPLRNLGSTLRC